MPKSSFNLRHTPIHKKGFVGSGGQALVATADNRQPLPRTSKVEGENLLLKAVPDLHVQTMSWPVPLPQVYTNKEIKN